MFLAEVSSQPSLDLFTPANNYWDSHTDWSGRIRSSLCGGCKKRRKKIETTFSQLNDQMMIRNYAKQSSVFFRRMVAKIAAFTILQYFNLLNHIPIGQVKYALI